jgi:hypothetical protein
VVVGGRMVVTGGVHRSFGSVGAELARVIEGLWSA